MERKQFLFFSLIEKSLLEFLLHLYATVFDQRIHVAENASFHLYQISSEYDQWISNAQRGRRSHIVLSPSIACRPRRRPDHMAAFDHR